LLVVQKIILPQISKLVMLPLLSFLSLNTLSNFRRDSLSNSECTCPKNPSVGKAMTIDQTDPASIQVLWVDGQENHVYLAEANGCFCSVVVNATTNTEAGKVFHIPCCGCET
jgi:hypothetical protein